MATPNAPPIPDTSPIANGPQIPNAAPIPNTAPIAIGAPIPNAAPIPDTSPIANGHQYLMPHQCLIQHQ